MNAVIYARYSSSNQREESIEGQIRECKEYAEKNDITIVNTYIDRALSARTDKRPAFQKMVQDSVDKKFDCVLVWKLDRFARNRKDSAIYRELLKNNGVKLRSTTEMIAETPDGIFHEGMLEMMAEYYSAELSVKVIRGRTENALKCKSIGGNIPIGYVIDKNQFYQINPLTAPAVLEAFQSYAEGKTMKEIAEELNGKGIRTTKGRKIRDNVVSRMLHNRKYIGEYRYKDIVHPNGIPAIVPQELFDKVQRRIEETKKAPATHKADEDYLLTTKLFCGKCNRLMVGESGTSHTDKKYYYYKCVGVKKKHDCDKKTVQKDWIEEIVLKQIETILHNDELLDKVADEILKLQKKENTTLPMLKKQYADIQRGIDNMLDAIQQGILTSSTKDRLEELEKQKAELSAQIIKEEIEQPMLTKEMILDWFGELKKYGVKRKDHKRRLIDLFLNSVHLFEDRLVINFNYKDGTEAVRMVEVENSIFSSDSATVAAPKKSVHNSGRIFLLIHY